METFTETHAFVGEADNAVSATNDAVRAANEVLDSEASHTVHLAISTQLVRHDHEWWVYVLTITRSYQV